MVRARVDQKKRKPLGFAVPDSVSGRDAWADARILSDPSTQPLPSEAKMAAAVADAPKRRSRETFPCTCTCGCGSTTHQAFGQCYMCGKDLHHTCSRMCGEIPEQSMARGLKTPYIPRRAACNGGGTLGEGKWIPRFESVVPDSVMRRASS